nr:MAG TPA: hypothetical protein [Caudoviricetes sp.]
MRLICLSHLTLNTANSKDLKRSCLLVETLIGF